LQDLNSFLLVPFLRIPTKNKRTIKLFKVEKVEIDGFWHRFDARCLFNEGVNIIIGRNGTGKTTFMNILHSILRVDLTGLSENDFESAKITLIKGKKRKTVKVTKLKDDGYPYPIGRISDIK